MIPAKGGTGSGKLNPLKTNPRRKPPIRVGRRLENDIADLDPCVNGLEVAKPLLTLKSLLVKRVQQRIWGRLGDQSATWGDEVSAQVRWMDCHSVEAIALVLTADWTLMDQHFGGYWGQWDQRILTQISQISQTPSRQGERLWRKQARRNLTVCPRYGSESCNERCTLRTAEQFHFFSKNKPPFYEYCPLAAHLTSSTLKGEMEKGKGNLQTKNTWQNRTD